MSVDSVDLRMIPAVIKRQIATAPVPPKYEEAKKALAECVRVDECKEWANRMAAMASYARQAKDKAMEEMAIRIRLRALRRVGELLAELPATMAAPYNQGPASPRKEAMDKANISSTEGARMMRVAGIPKQMFADKVDASPPTSWSKLDPGWAASTVSKNSPAFEEYVKVFNAIQPLFNLRFMGVINIPDFVKKVIASQDSQNLINNMRLLIISATEFLDELEQKLPPSNFARFPGETNKKNNNSVWAMPEEDA